MVLKGERVMVKTFLDQPIVRYVLYEGATEVCVGKSVDQPQGWAVPKSEVYEYDPALLEAMMAFDNVLDERPEGLHQLWKRAKPLLARSL